MAVSVQQRPWDEIDAEFSAWNETHPEFAHIAAIVKSVRSVGAEADLAAFTSHLDLMVVAQPVPEPPHDLVAVRTASEGRVPIEYLAVTGLNDKIVRPANEAIPLFWRFMIEKFGVRPGGHHFDG